MFGRRFIFNDGGAGQGRTWPVLLVLLVAALVPAGCVLWFMNAAMRNEQLAMRQRLADAHRQQLADVRRQVEELWSRRQQAIERASARPPAEAFAELVRSGMADGAVIRDETGEIAYPISAEALENPSPIEPAEPWNAAVEAEDGRQFARAAELYARSAAATGDADARAVALQSQARCLAKAGDVAGAVHVLVDVLGGSEYRAARDETGRLLAPSALLYALRLKPTDAVRDELTRRLEDYGGPPMPSAQRRLLLAELGRIGGVRSRFVPAEDLAAGATTVKPEKGLRRHGSFWAMGSSDGRVVGLYTDRAAHVLPAPAPIPGTRVELRAPGDRVTGGDPFISTSASAPLTDWRLALYLDGSDAGVDGARRRAAVYLWTGAAGVVVIVALTLSAGGYVTRQMALTRLKNDLIATVTHELKTPLASTRLLVDTLLESRREELPARAREYLELIARENQRLGRLIDNFLTFSRMERNKRAFESEPVDIAWVLATATQAVAERFVTPDARLTVDVAADLPDVCGDRDALVTAVLNLLDNAHKYTGDQKDVRLTAAAGDGHVTIAVEDNGVGISRAACRRVFDRFYQVDRTLSRKTGGCGLGLAIVKFIVESHGGTVDVNSRPGEGTRFVIRLPAMSRDRANHQEAAPCPAAAATKPS